MLKCVPDRFLHAGTKKLLAACLYVYDAQENTNFVENPTVVNEATVPSSNNLEPSYQQFQLPPELLQDWPWAFDLGPFVNYPG